MSSFSKILGRVSKFLDIEDQQHGVKVGCLEAHLASQKCS